MKGLLILACCLALPIAARAAGRHEVLNDAEIDQLRDTALEPDKRLKLYIEFARTRLTSLEQSRTDPKVTDKAQEAHDWLQDFLDVYDELDDNVDNFADRKADMRKALKGVIEADAEFQSRLRAVQDSATASKADAQKYEFALRDALDAVEKSAGDHKQVLAEQGDLAKHKRLIHLEEPGTDNRKKPPQ